MQRELRTRSEAALQAGLEELLRAQDESGCWKGRYNGPLFLIPGYVAAFEATGERMDPAVREGFRAYLCQHQNEDGGWGLHLEDESRVYATVTCYVAARLCGLEAGAMPAQRARNWMKEHGDARFMAPWGKYLLALLGLYDHRGLLPVPPELWLLPRWLPVHPGRLWNHARMVYLPLSYLYGSRWRAEDSPRLEALRREIFTVDFETVPWEATLFLAGKPDQYIPLSRAYRWLSRCLARYEAHPARRLRKRALDFVYDQIRQEDENTHYICVGPVSKIFNLLTRHDREPDGEAMRAHWRELETYLCRDEEGASVHGYNHSRLWDTSFALQALEAAASRNRSERLRDGWNRGRQYVLSQQVREETPSRRRYFRDPSAGGWPFSDALHGWPISDCTAEGLKVCLARTVDGECVLAPEWCDAAVDRILEWQNPDGGWPTYERIRGPAWLERFNPSLVFGEIMVDYSHVECTSACMQALRKALPFVPPERRSGLEAAIEQGRRFLGAKQREDGSWLGGWGVCFTYGTWFGTWGLHCADSDREGDRLGRAVEFLLEQQLEDGGWAETVANCRTGSYLPEGKPSHPVKTAWAVLALTRCGTEGKQAVAEALEFLDCCQQPDGSWAEEPLTGVFNRTCAIRYDNYRKIFPVWALAEGIKYLEK